MFATPDLSNLQQSRALSRAGGAMQALIEDETDPVANMANCAALIFNSVPRLNWAGFYLLKGGELVLGPFQGQPACVRIAFGRGVCRNGGGKVGLDASRRDVNEFPGHIACDSASRSEIVVPLLTEDSHLHRRARCR